MVWVGNLSTIPLLNSKQQPNSIGFSKANSLISHICCKGGENLLPLMTTSPLLRQHAEPEIAPSASRVY